MIRKGIIILAAFIIGGFVLPMVPPLAMWKFKFGPDPVGGGYLDLLGFLLLAVLNAAFPFVAGLAAYRLVHRCIPLGHCKKCGYNLTGNVSGVCPECGTKIEQPPIPPDVPSSANHVQP